MSEWLVPNQLRRFWLAGTTNDRDLELVISILYGSSNTRCSENTIAFNGSDLLDPTTKNFGQSSFQASITAGS